MALPDWVEKFKKEGCDIKNIKGHFYMYERSSIWDPVQKKPVKKTGAYLGTVTPDGIVPPKKRVDKPVFSLEYGATQFLFRIAEDILQDLRKHFDINTANSIWAIAMLKLIAAPCPFKRVGLQYETSWMSIKLPNLYLTPSSLTKLIDRVGNNRSACAAFMREHIGDNPYILIDGTKTQSKSAGIDRALPGHSKTHKFIPQINQIYLLSQAAKEGIPVFYRNVAGNITDVTALELTIKDSGIEKATVIADTGFGSSDNFESIINSNLDYIIPLKRNSAEVVLHDVKYEDAFFYHGRAIWAHSIQKTGYRICVFRDESEHAKEAGDFVLRGEKHNAAAALKKNFDPNRDLRDVPKEMNAHVAEFGVIIMRTNLMDVTNQYIYEAYKLRWQIEQLFDTMRNTCECDTSFMQDDVGFEAWSFINHIILIVAIRIISLVRQKDKGKDWSLKGILEYLSKINMVKIADMWKLTEITKKTRDLLADLGVDFMSST